MGGLVNNQKHSNRKIHNQYFTPEIAVEEALTFVPEIDVTNIIDPAVGEGVFLKASLERWNNTRLFGIDIDSSVIKNLRSLRLPNSFYLAGDSLLDKTWGNSEINKIILNGGFDLVAGNPPFGSWFQRIKEPSILATYKLAYRNGKLMRGQAIEVLFSELFIRLAIKGGYIVIVLPDGILSNPKYRYVREFILKETEVKHIISLPRNIFRDTSAKTSILILEKKRNNHSHYSLCLHNLQKTRVGDDTIEVNSNNLLNRMDYCYYYYLKRNSLNYLNGVKFAPLKNFIVYCKTGKTLYGKERRFTDKGLKFLHATNITELGINYKKDENFIDPSSRMDFPDAHAKAGDILFVRVGVGCAGRVAIVYNKEDEGVATDYIHIFRVKDINPYFLVVYLKTKYGKDSITLLKHGVGTVSINKTDLLSIPIPVIPEKIQKYIRDKYKEILRKWRFAIKNEQDLSVYEKMLKNLIKELEKLLEENSNGK